VLQLSRRQLVVPVIGAMDLERARQFDDRLLHAVRERRARVVVIDVTGVPEIDTPVAAQLQTTFRAVGLLGARVIVTGVSGELAETLVDLGVDLAGLDSYADLQSGVESARGQT
jgi:rsbT co-antagonist protein RsbR